MKNLKKTLLILLSAASIALSGCGNAASGPAAGTAATEAASEESTEKESIAASGTAGEESADTAGTASASTNEMPPAVAPDASVSYLGPAGTYTEEAAMFFFPESKTMIPESTVDGAIADVMNGTADYAVIPQENTLGGAVTNYVDALIKQKNAYVIGEVILPISQTLMGVPGAKIEDIKTVCSHAQGIKQSETWRKENLPYAVTEEKASTAAAAEYVAEKKDKSIAAIAAPGAAALYGLDVLAENVQITDANKTRFYVLSAEEPAGEEFPRAVFVAACKASRIDDIIVEIHDSGVELVSLHDRPEGSELGSYYYVIEVEREGGITQEQLDRISGIEEVRLIGKFRSFEKKAEGQASAATEAAPAAGTAGESEVSEDKDEEILKTISGMSTQEKLAQMMIVALRSDGKNTKTVTQINKDYADLLSKYDFGGIILFAGNIVDPTQTVTLIRDCQVAAMKSEQGIPMFICVDQEGGMVNRISYGTTGSGNMALAAAGDTALTEETARMMGEEMRALGFNMDFAPDSDVNSNPANPVIGVRSFSDDPNLAAEHVTAFIRGMDSAKISTALKHFPGHGNVGEDSHTYLPSSDFTLEEIKACDLIPFQAGIDEGTDMIMTAHIQFPQIEKETYASIADGEKINLPATLSRTIVTGLLREQMGYDGVVITDAMVMDAIDEHFDPTDAAMMAINADVDILLCPVDLYKDEEVNTLADMDKYMERLLARVGAGDISVEELDNSVYRILKLKKERDIHAPTEEQISEAADAVGTSADHKREWEIAQAGMTLLKNENHALPIDKEQSVLILYPVEKRGPSVKYAVSRLEKEKLLDASKVTTMCYADLKADDAKLQKALAKADKLVVLSQSTSRNKEIVKLIAQAHKSGKQAVLLSLNLPYDAACYEEMDAVLCAYQPYGSAHDEEGNGPFNLNVAVAICTAYNQSVPSGVLPVNVPKVEVKDGKVTFLDEYLYERGFGLEIWGD